MKSVNSFYLKSPEEIKKVEEKGSAYVSPDAYIYNAGINEITKVASDYTPMDFILSFGSPEEIKRRGLVYFNFYNNEKGTMYSHKGINAPSYQTCWIGEFVDPSSIEGRFENSEELLKTIKLCGYSGVVVLQNGTVCYVEFYNGNDPHRTGFVFSENDIKDMFEKASKNEKGSGSN